MWWQPEERRRTNVRAFRPSLDGSLEPRLLLASRVSALQAGTPRIRVQVASGGTAALVTDVDGEKYLVAISGGGIVKVRAASGGRINITARGTNIDSALTINPVPAGTPAGSAHDPRNFLGTQDRIIKVANVTVRNGTIGSIEGYRVAQLSGSVTATSTNRVDRIAFESFTAGAGIQVGGDLNTLDVLNNLTVSGGIGVTVGRDLNNFNVGQDFTITGGASFIVNRDVGLVAQPAKGTGPAGQGGLVTGNMTVDVGSAFIIRRALDAQFIVAGSTSGASRIQIASGGTNFVSRGGFTP